MKTRIQKWGNSLGLRIPRSVAEEVGVYEGSVVDIRALGNEVVLTPQKPARYRLKDLLKEVRPENIHEEIDAGDAVGRESW